MKLRVWRKVIGACVVVTTYCALTVILGHWSAEQEPDFKPRVEILRVPQGVSFDIVVPDIEGAIGSAISSTHLDVAALIVDEAGQRHNVGPVIRLAYASTRIRAITVPQGLPPGYYTVILGMRYALNPIRYVNETKLLAVLIVEANP